MTTRLTRRSFAAMSLGLAGVGMPHLGLAQTLVDDTNSSVLMEPSSLVSVLKKPIGDDALTDVKATVVVDVRPRADYDSGHIKGAVHLDPNAVVAPHSPVAGTLLPFDEIEALLKDLGIDADKPVVFYDDRGGFHAARMFWLMEYLGHRNTSVLNGGYSAWVETGEAASHEVSEVGRGTFQASLSPRRHASAEEVLVHQNHPDAVLIDVRPPSMFEDGHIPWAINIPWSLNLGEDGRFRSADDLLAHFASHGVTPKRDIIMHCQDGLASAHSYVALRLLGFPRVRVYHRSWAEWGNDPALPKVTS